MSDAINKLRPPRSRQMHQAYPCPDFSRSSGRGWAHTENLLGFYIPFPWHWPGAHYVFCHFTTKTSQSIRFLNTGKFSYTLQKKKKRLFIFIIISPCCHHYCPYLTQPSVWKDQQQGLLDSHNSGTSSVLHRHFTWACRQSRVSRVQGLGLNSSTKEDRCNTLWDCN